MSEEDQDTFKRNMEPHGGDEGHESVTFSGGGSAGRSETELEGSLHDLLNSLVAGGAANALGDVGVAGACGRTILTIMW